MFVTPIACGWELRGVKIVHRNYVIGLIYTFGAPNVVYKSNLRTSLKNLMEIRRTLILGNNLSCNSSDMFIIIIASSFIARSVIVNYLVFLFLIRLDEKTLHKISISYSFSTTYLFCVRM